MSDFIFEEATAEEKNEREKQTSTVQHDVARFLHYIFLRKIFNKQNAMQAIKGV